MSSVSEHEDLQETLGDALIDLENAAQIPVKQRSVKITRVIERLSSQAYTNGLTRDHVDKVIDIITLPNQLDQASVGSLIRNLYPADKVSDDSVIKVVGSLGHGQRKLVFTTQAALLKWLILVYDNLENSKTLSQLYGTLFNLLDTTAIRAPLCHLLSLITRRKHVRPFRIQMLLDIARRAGSDPPLVGLIRVYKDYYPDVIVGDATSGRASVFAHPNSEWKQRLAEIKDANAKKIEDGELRQQAFRVARRGAKRGKVSVIPEVRTSRAEESSTTLEEIENVTDFIGKLEKIELPNQLVSVLGDPLLQKLLQLKSSPVILQRVDYWLMTFFEECLFTGKEPDVEDMLVAILDYTKYTKTIPPSCMEYLRAMLPTWNGITSCQVILDLLSWVPITPFEDLYNTTFQPLEEAILDNTTAKLSALLNFYTNLLHHWSTTLLSTTPSSSTASTITALTTHANTLALSLISYTPSIDTYSTILTFYETTASLHSHSVLGQYIRITTPPSALTYIMNFSPSLSTLSRLFAILALYKRAFESAMVKNAISPSAESQTQIETQPYPKDYVNHFNGFLMDICNCLWRSRAFNTSDMNALGCYLPPPLLPVLTAYVASLNTGLALPSLFGMSQSPVLCAISIEYLRGLEDENEEVISTRHAGPVTQRTLVQLGKDGGLKLLWSEYRLGVLRHLESRGVEGVGELMYNTMKHLMTAREGLKV